MENQDLLIQSLKKPPSQRFHQDLVQIMKLARSVQFFSTLMQDMTQKDYKECCQFLSYQFKQENQVVIEYGQTGHEFYVIIKGLVGVLVPNRNGDLVQTVELKDGAAFGELALNEDRPRKASVVCKTPSHFAILDQQNYKRLLEALMKLKQKRMIDLLKKNQLFRNLSSLFLIKLSYHFNQEKYIRNFELYKEGKTLTTLYYIKEGEFRLTKNILNKNFGQKTQKKEIAIVSKFALLGIEDIHGLLYSHTCKCISDKCTVLAINKEQLVPQLMQTNTNTLMETVQQKRTYRERLYDTMKKIPFVQEIREPVKQKTWKIEKLKSKSPKIGRRRDKPSLTRSSNYLKRFLTTSKVTPPRPRTRGFNQRAEILYQLQKESKILDKSNAFVPLFKAKYSRPSASRYRHSKLNLSVIANKLL